jgi:hypothetical protein
MMHSLKHLIFESAARYCDVYRASNGKWYLDLAAYEYGEHDDAQTYGPFRSFDSVIDYLHNFPSPGGWTSDASGERPPPVNSPNGSPVHVPTGPSGGAPRKKLNDDELKVLVKKQLRDYAEDYGSDYMPSVDSVLDDIVSRSEGMDISIDYNDLRQVVAASLAQRLDKGPSTRTAPTTVSVSNGELKKEPKVKSAYKVYGGTGGTGKASPGSPSIHTRIKGKVYAPTGESQFSVGDGAEVSLGTDGKTLQMKKPDSDHTQSWAARESIERVVRDMIKLLK